MEPTTGIEPVNLFLTKEALYRLSYVGGTGWILPGHPCWNSGRSICCWSGRRGSNSRHSAWKAEALPTELLPPTDDAFPSGKKFMECPTPRGHFKTHTGRSHVVSTAATSARNRNLLHQTPFMNGGGGRIRTSEGFADRFTVCSLWPLGNPTGLIWRSSGGRRSRVPLRTTRLRRPTVSVTLMLPVWSQRRDSNPRPTDYKSVALPTELRWPAVSMPVFEFQITHVNRVDICL